MEHRRIAGEPPQHGPHRIGRGWIKAGMFQQPRHPLQAIGEGRRSFQSKPGVEDYWLVLPALVKSLHRLLALSDRMALQGPEASASQGHRGALHRRRCGRRHLRISGGHPPAPHGARKQAIAITSGPDQAPLGRAALQGRGQGHGQGRTKTLLQGKQRRKKGRWIGLRANGNGGIFELGQTWKSQQHAAAGLG